MDISNILSGGNAIATNLDTGCFEDLGIAAGSFGTVSAAAGERRCQNQDCTDEKLVSMVPKRATAQFVTKPTVKEKPLLVNGFTTVFQVDGNAAKLADLKHPDDDGGSGESKTIFRIVPNTHAHIVNYIVVDDIAEAMRKIDDGDPVTMRKLLDAQKVSADQMLRKLMLEPPSAPGSSALSSLTALSATATPTAANNNVQMSTIVDLDGTDDIGCASISNLSAAPRIVPFTTTSIASTIASTIAAPSIFTTAAFNSAGNLNLGKVVRPRIMTDPTRANKFMPIRPKHPATVDVTKNAVNPIASVINPIMVAESQTLSMPPVTRQSASDAIAQHRPIAVTATTSTITMSAPLPGAGSSAPSASTSVAASGGIKLPVRMHPNLKITAVSSCPDTNTTQFAPSKGIPISTGQYIATVPLVNLQNPPLAASPTAVTNINMMEKPIFDKMQAELNELRRTVRLLAEAQAKTQQTQLVVPLPKPVAIRPPQQQPQMMQQTAPQRIQLQLSAQQRHQLHTMTQRGAKHPRPN